MSAFESPTATQRVQLIDLHPKLGDLLEEAQRGLGQEPKTLPCKYFYDALGARLFEAITELPEYYPTRTEISILDRSVAEMAEVVGPHATLIEFGSGTGIKTQKLLDALLEPSGCVLIDISRDALESSAAQLADRHDALDIVAVCGDYTQNLRLPRPRRPSARSVAFFPGSTIGNFTHLEARGFLRRIAELVGPTGGLLIGIDRKKDPAIIEAAYNDALGVTAAFNLNILARLNRLGANFELSQFSHRAPYVAEAGRIEMQLVSETEQSVQLGGTDIYFDAAEVIVTEHSHKYDLAEFEALAGEAGFRISHHWSDPRQWFSVCFLEREEARS